jgi:hypothetical protein
MKRRGSYGKGITVISKGEIKGLLGVLILNTPNVEGIIS